MYIYIHTVTDIAYGQVVMSNQFDFIFLRLSCCGYIPPVGEVRARYPVLPSSSSKTVFIPPPPPLRPPILPLESVCLEWANLSIPITDILGGVPEPAFFGRPVTTFSHTLCFSPPSLPPTTPYFKCAFIRTCGCSFVPDAPSFSPPVGRDCRNRDIIRL